MRCYIWFLIAGLLSACAPIQQSHGAKVLADLKRIADQGLISDAQQTGAALNLRFTVTQREHTSCYPLFIRWQVVGDDWLKEAMNNPSTRAKATWPMIEYATYRSGICDLPQPESAGVPGGTLDLRWFDGYACVTDAQAANMLPSSKLVTTASGTKIRTYNGRRSKLTISSYADRCAFAVEITGG